MRLRMALFAVTGLTSSLHAQPQLESLLPTGAKVIETADLSAAAGQPRALVLWAINPTFNRYPNYQGGVCTYIPFGTGGHEWIGPTRLSLFDTAGIRMINTIEIREEDGPEDRFAVPVCSLPSYDSPDRLGVRNLSLRDFTGEGRNLQFAMSYFEAAGITSTSVFGYEIDVDRVIQFPIEVRSNAGKQKTTKWVWQVFAHPPVRPGYWQFVWEPGHGGDDIRHENMTFDKTRRIFVDRSTVTHRTR